MPAQAGPARVRFVDGAPSLESLVAGSPQSLGPYTYLQVDSKTVVSQFAYSTMSSFVTMPAGTHSLVARNAAGYAVGPLKTTALSGGGRYTVVVVGAYPHYAVLTFEEPSGSSDAQLALYEASPTVRSADFGSFTASSRSDYKKLGSAAFGHVAIVPLGVHVTNIGGYAGKGTKPLMCGSAICGDVTPADTDAFDKHNELPFHNAGRLSLFLFDPGTGSDSAGPVFGSLDR